MKKQVIILMSVFAILMSACIYSEIGVLASFGVATFRMDDMKYLQEYILSNYPVDGKIISSFPPYVTTSVNIFKQVLPLLRIGAGYTFTNTGGRSNYTDYSGNIHTDMIAQSHNLGAFASYALFGDEHLELSMFGRLDANFTFVEISSTISVLGTWNGISNKYKSISPNATAGIELFYHLKAFSLGMDGGYLVDLPGELTNRDGGNELTDPYDRQRVLTTDWTGWRVGLKALVWLNF